MASATLRRLVAVVGGRARSLSGPAATDLGEALGRELARRGYGVITGGDDGVAAAVNRGCVQAGGTTIALLKGTSADQCSEGVRWAIPTSFDLSRSAPLIWSGVGVIALEGGFGTLFEIALALDAERPLVIVPPQRLLNLDAIDRPLCRVMQPRPPATSVAAEDVVDELEALVDSPANSSADRRG